MIIYIKKKEKKILITLGTRKNSCSEMDKFGINSLFEGCGYGHRIRKCFSTNCINFSSIVFKEYPIK